MNNTAVSFSPGEILRDELDARGWSAAEFAQIIGRPPQAISEILNGHKEITTETAVELASALGTSANLWLNLQTNYRLRSATHHSEELSNVERRARLRSLIPVQEVVKRGWLPDTDDVDVLEQSVCTFLGMSNIEHRPPLRSAARRSGIDTDFTPEQTAWIARVANQGSLRELSEFDHDALGLLAAELPSRLRDPVEIAHLEDWLANCGVALVCEMPLRSSKLDGAVVWPTDSSPAIGISTRGNRFDSFVFTLLHEIAHLWHRHVGPGNATVDEELITGPATSGQEEEANSTAGQWIFPNRFEPGTARVTISTVTRLAKEHHVHPSLVIGRLQHDERLKWSQLRAHIPRVRELIPDLGGRG